MKKLYIAIITTVFLAFAVVFLTFPRSTVSELEKRELATFPEFSWQRLFDGSFTRDVSSWFSDSEPYRDRFMALSMMVKDHQRLILSDQDNVTFHAAEADGSSDPETATSTVEEEQAQDEGGEVNLAEYKNKVTAEANSKISHAGIMVIGTGKNVRALMAYGGGPTMGNTYAQIANEYQKKLGNDVQVYCMVIPTAVEFYCPDKARKSTKSQRATITNIYQTLDPKVKAVDIYTTLGQHAEESIYLRTDHHWAPLGAYYAAQKFAAVAGVPFRDLTHYEQHVVHDYVGSMYGFSKDISIKNAPEDFVYYIPKEVDYTTTYTIYDVNKDYQVTGEHKPIQGKFFMHYNDGSGAAYSTFMGGDSKITCVRTSTNNHRRVLILKDSFGNALPGYMFYSFEEVHVVDFRYFRKNIAAYIRDNHITDVLFANNVFMTCSANTAKNYRRFLTQ